MMKTILTHFPPELEELKPLRQWVCYRLQPDEKGKKKKIPMNPHTGDFAKANDPATWGTFAEAEAALAKYSFDGVGFEFANGYAGIDIDNCIDSDGNIQSFAQEIIETLDSYTEYSLSKCGLHILIKAPAPFEGRKKNPEIGLEIYNTGRFFVMTGDVLGQPKPIQERTAQVQTIRKKFMPEKDAQKTAPSENHRVADETTGDIWQKMFNSRNGAKIRALYNGDTSGHGGDHSSADQALMNHLAYWTNGDTVKMDAMFRESGLMRPKWDERHGAGTYGQMTIETALEHFTPYVPVATKHRDYDSLPDIDEINPETESIEKVKSAFSTSKQPDGIYQYIYGEMGEDLTRFRKFKDRKTGFANLDEITSLYPGTYVLGAISSLGKTTFVHQMGDQLAEMGNHVLYFSLEQTRLEMVTKSISRMTAQNSCFDDFATAVSAIGIRRGHVTDAVKQATKDYIKKCKTVSVIECDFETTINTILEYVTSYIEANDGVKPVVIIDYLQIIKSSDPRQTTKDAVDTHVRALKRLQSKNDLTVIIICSLNRANYLMPIDFESFKESGGIEYTADVVWGLQLSVLNKNDVFDKESKIRAKREAIREAKLEFPRKIELVCLKNRYGKSSYSCMFDYFPIYDLFVPEGSIPYNTDFEPTEDNTPF